MTGPINLPRQLYGGPRRRLSLHPYWIFQSNPRHFRLPETLKEAPAHDNVIEFLVTKYDREILPGDTVYVCFGGQTNPGLHATATVQTSPSAAIAPADWQVQYATAGLHPWDEKAKKPLRVRLKIERLLEPPVARCDIYELHELARHQFVTARIGTNFRLTPGQASAIEQLIAAPRALGDPTPDDNQSRSTRLAAPKSVRSQPDLLQNIH